jgi:hypothetical protein
MDDRIVFAPETSSNKLSSNEPQCMKDRPKTQPGRRDLNDEEVEQARKELINNSFLSLEFPRKVKLRHDPPLAQQNYTLFTFTPSKGAVADKDGCYGVVKIRGTFPTPDEADSWAETLIRQVDSYNENIIGYVGKDFPLTMDSKFCLSSKEVDIRTKMDTVARDNIKQQRQQDQAEMSQIMDRQKELLADTTELKETSIDDLDYYISLRVKRANIRVLQEEIEKKRKESSKILKKTTIEINDLDDKHPEYIKDYTAKYQKALEAIGGDAHDNRMIELMK